MPQIETRNLSVFYEKKQNRIPVLSSLSLVFPTRKVSVLEGASGAGKTTFLDAVAGLIPVEGELLFDGVDVQNLPTQERDLAYVNQDFFLYPRLSVFDNWAFPLKIAGGKRDEVTQRVKAIAQEFSLTLFLDRRPSQLSLGQQQRVALAKALLRHPSLLLLDEPFSNSDPQTKETSKKFLKETIQKYSLTVLYSCHDHEDAQGLGDEFFRIEDGTITALGKEGLFE